MFPRVDKTPFRHGWSCQFVSRFHRLPKKIPGKPGLWPALAKLSKTPICIMLSFTHKRRNYAGYFFSILKNVYYSPFKYSSSSSFNSFTFSSSSEKSYF